MMAKLLKHEYRATARTFYPLLGAVLILSGLSRVMEWIGAGVPGAQYAIGTLRALLTMFTILSLFVLMVCTLLVTVQRFYKNVLGDEGYLTLTLPATPAQHIASKLIVGTGWTVAAMAVVILALFMLGASMAQMSAESGGPVNLSLAQVAEQFEDFFGFSLWRGAGIVGLSFLCGVVDSYLMAYFCMALGGQWPQQRLAASIGAFVALNFIRQLLFILVFILLGTTIAAPGTPLYQALTGLSAGSVFQTIPAFFCAMCAAESAVFFFAARWLLTKRLNLA